MWLGVSLTKSDFFGDTQCAGLQRNADYLPADLLLALIYAVAVGVRRINKTELLHYNGAFLDLLGLDHFLNETTLRRFLQRLSPQSIRQLVALHDWFRTQLLIRPTVPSSLILDLDSVVLTLYGQQQGAQVGYNPKKKGRRSYHPALGFEAYHEEFWHGSLRPGNTSANTGVLFFLQHCLAKVPAGMARSRIRVRADSGFFDGKFLLLLERLGLGYVIVAKNYRTIKSRARESRLRDLGNGLAVAEFRYQAHGWPKARRCVVMPSCSEWPNASQHPVKPTPISSQTSFRRKMSAVSSILTKHNKPKQTCFVGSCRVFPRISTCRYNARYAWHAGRPRLRSGARRQSDPRSGFARIRSARFSGLLG